MTDEEISVFASGLVKKFKPAELISIFSGINNFQKYQSDPVAFCKDQFKEDYTPDIARMMESVRDNTVTIAKSANATGKTHGAARVAIWFKKCFPNSQVYTAAAPPEENLKKLLWGEIGSIVSKHPALFEEDSVSSLNIKKSDLEFITGVAIPSSGTSSEREAKFSGKHAPHLLFILDEGDAIPDEVYKGIESCMSGGFVRLLIMFNPRSAAGAPYRMERDGVANIVTLSAMDHPNVLTGKDIIPGAVNRDTTVRRVNEWCRPLADTETFSKDSCFVLPDFLEGKQAPKLGSQDKHPPLRPGPYKIINPAFSYMVLAKYPGQAENQLISREWINAARLRYDQYVSVHGETPPVGVVGVQGQDVAEQGTDANVACFRYGSLVLPLVSWTGVDPVMTSVRAAEEYHDRKNILCCNVDATGVGAGVAPYMLRHGRCNAVSIKVASSPTKKTEMGEFKILRDQLRWGTREWLRTDPNAMLPPDEPLIEELLAVTYSVRKGKIETTPKDDVKKLIGRSPDKSDALDLTFYEPDIKGRDLS